MSLMNLNIFRAYDIRGKYPTEVNAKNFFEIGLALGRYFISAFISENVNQRCNSRKRKSTAMFISQDVRLSSPQLKKSFIKGLNDGSGGKLNIIDIGVSTTPMLNFCVNKFKTLGGAIITASHDPKNYNGLKVVVSGAGILSGKDILRIMKKQQLIISDI